MRQRKIENRENAREEGGRDEEEEEGVEEICWFVRDEDEREWKRKGILGAGETERRGRTERYARSKRNEDESQRGSWRIKEADGDGGRGREGDIQIS